MSDLIDGERYEYVNGTSRKFWEWRLYGEEPGAFEAFRLVIKWGRLGTAGQFLSEMFTSRRLADWKVKVKVAEKTGKGYRLASQRGQPKRTTFTFRIPGKAKPEPDVAPLLTGVRRVTLRD